MNALTKTVFGLLILLLVLASPGLTLATPSEAESRILLAENQTEPVEECCREEGERHMGPGGPGRGHRGEGMHHGGRGKGGMGHGMRGQGMHRGMHHGQGGQAAAECPQPRSTAKAPDEIFNRANPLETTPDNIEAGRLLYQLNVQPTCTMCHGRLGDGTGMMGGGLTPPPRNFTCKETMQAVPDGQLFWIIQNGSPGTGMPAFSDLSDEQIWKTILYVREFSQ